MTVIFNLQGATQQAYQLIEAMRGRGIIVSPYLDSAMVEGIYRNMGFDSRDDATYPGQGAGRKVKKWHFLLPNNGHGVQLVLNNQLLLILKVVASASCRICTTRQRLVTPAGHCRPAATSSANNGGMQSAAVS